MKSEFVLIKVTLVILLDILIVKELGPNFVILNLVLGFVILSEF